MTQQNEEMDSYLEKLVVKLKQDPKWELRQEFGRMLLRHIDSFTEAERIRYKELKQLLKD